MIGALAALDALGAVALVVDGERVPVRVTEKVHENREIRVHAVERDGDREFRVRTEWAAGWLDPAVGVRTRDGDVFCPAGRLDAVEICEGRPAGELAGCRVREGRGVRPDGEPRDE